MKFLAVLLVVLAAAQAKVWPSPSAYGFLERSAAESWKRREAEEKFLSQQRIVGGEAAGLGQYPFQAGLLIDIIGIEGIGICGASLVTANRLVTAAHCWFDGRHQGWRVTVVLGTVTLFTGGTRIETSNVVNHPNWQPFSIRNDVAVIYLPSNVQFSNVIAPIALPTGDELSQNFVGASAIASGFGLTSDGGIIADDQYLSHVTLNVITNSVCSSSFFIIQPTNLCTSGVGGVGACGGDSGGPLITISNNRPIMIGITSFGSAIGCQAHFPTVYARVTSFIDFINEHL